MYNLMCLANKVGSNRRARLSGQPLIAKYPIRGFDHLCIELRVVSIRFGGSAGKANEVQPRIWSISFGDGCRLIDNGYDVI